MFVPDGFQIEIWTTDERFEKGERSRVDQGGGGVIELVPDGHDKVGGSDTRVGIDFGRGRGKGRRRFGEVGEIGEVCRRRGSDETKRDEGADGGMLRGVSGHGIQNLNVVHYMEQALINVARADPTESIPKTATESV